MENLTNNAENNFSLSQQEKIDKLTRDLEEFKEEDIDRDYFVAQIIFNFFSACQQRAPKSHLFIDEEEFNKKHLELLSLGNGVYRKRQKEIIWNEDCLLEDFIDASIKELGLKIEEAGRKIRTYNDNDLSPLQKQLKKFSEEIRFANPIEEMRFSQLFYDVMEFIAAKQKQILEDYQKGAFKLDEKKVLAKAIELDMAYDFEREMKKRNNQMKVVTKAEASKRIDRAMKKKGSNPNDIINLN